MIAAQIDYRDRLQLARQLKELWLAAPGEAAQRADQLADDPKSEVRCQVAESLASAPEGAFRSLAARLSGDSCHFVREAVRRALERRQRSQTQSSRRRKSVGRTGADFEEFERLYGPKAAVEARRIAERMYDALGGVVAHDLIGMLAPIRAHTNTLLSLVGADQADSDKLQLFLRRVRDRVTHMELLVQDMLGYSRSISEIRRSEWLSVIVTEAATEVRENLLARGLAADNVAVDLAVPRDLAVPVSRPHIQTALRHLLLNACEAFLEGTTNLRPGCVRVRAECQDDAAQIVVEDDGPGIDPELLAELREFLPGKTTKRAYGTGMGLPTVHRYVTAHQGSFDLSCREAGRGVRAVIRLPLEAPAPEDETQN